MMVRAGAALEPCSSAGSPRRNPARGSSWGKVRERALQRSRRQWGDGPLCLPELVIRYEEEPSQAPTWNHTFWMARALRGASPRVPAGRLEGISGGLELEACLVRRPPIPQRRARDAVQGVRMDARGPVGSGSVSRCHVRYGKLEESDFWAGGPCTLVSEARGGFGACPGRVAALRNLCLW